MLTIGVHMRFVCVCVICAQALIKAVLAYIRRAGGIPALRATVLEAKKIAMASPTPEDEDAAVRPDEIVASRSRRASAQPGSCFHSSISSGVQ